MLKWRKLGTSIVRKETRILESSVAVLKFNRIFHIIRWNREVQYFTISDDAANVRENGNTTFYLDEEIRNEENQSRNWKMSAI